MLSEMAIAYGGAGTRPLPLKILHSGLLPPNPFSTTEGLVVQTFNTDLITYRLPTFTTSKFRSSIVFNWNGSECMWDLCLDSFWNFALIDKVVLQQQRKFKV